MVCLPSGGQYGLQGQSINIPISIQTLCLQLPRTSESLPYVKIFSAKKRQLLWNCKYKKYQQSIGMVESE